MGTGDGCADEYGDWADFYVSGSFGQFSSEMAATLPGLLDAAGVAFDQDAAVLDVGCGEGSFARSIAERSNPIVGVDRSDSMLAYARNQTPPTVSLVRADVRALPFEAAFDVATSWFDTLNYLLVPDDLRDAFREVRTALCPGGVFVFDVATVYRFAEYALTLGEFPSYVVQNEPDRFEVHHDIAYDFESNRYSLEITGFERIDGEWTRIREHHVQRGYRLDEVRECFRSAGFTELLCTDDPEEESPPDRTAKRVWFVLRA